MIKEDFPAGHSMNTDWFAIDKDGNVGFFDTGPDGALPITFKQGEMLIDYLREFAFELVDRVYKLILDKSLICEIKSYCKKIEEKHYHIDYEDSFYLSFEGIILLNDGLNWSDLKFTPDLNEMYDFFVLQLSDTNPLYYISGIEGFEKEFEQAIKDGKIIGGFELSWVIDEYYDEENGQAGIDLFNVFRFVHERIEGPYEKQFTPKFPLKEHMISEQAKARAIRLNDLAFKEINEIEIERYTKCDLYI